MNFNEFVVDGTNVEDLFITHLKCGWEWLSYPEHGTGSVPLNKLILVASKHKCEEKAE